MRTLKSAAFVLSCAVLVGGCEREEPAGLTVADAPGGQPSVNAQGAATLEFQNRIKAYLEIHHQAEGKVPNLKRTDDPQEISDREALLAKAIQTLRAGATIGEIFRPSTSRTSSRSSRTISPRARPPTAKRSSTSCRRT